MYYIKNQVKQTVNKKSDFRSGKKENYDLIE